MATFVSLYELKERLGVYYSAGSLNEIRLLLIGGRESERQKACEFVKERVLEELLEEAKTQGRISGYEVPIIDLNYEKVPTLDERWDSIGNKDRKVYLPVFHHAEKDPYLPLHAFDRGLPGIFSISRKGFYELMKMNGSKTNCYSLLFLSR